MICLVLKILEGSETRALCSGIIGFNCFAFSVLGAVQNFLSRFNNTNGVEIQKLNEIASELEVIIANLPHINSSIDALQSIVEENEQNMEYLNSTLHCLAESNCTSKTPTTTVVTYPVFNCTESTKNGIKVGDFGGWTIENITEFGNCNLTLKAYYATGLWFNIEITNFEGDEGTLRIDDSRGNETM